jgi:hypothetical protein
MSIPFSPYIHCPFSLWSFTFTLRLFYFRDGNKKKETKEQSIGKCNRANQSPSFISGSYTNVKDTWIEIIVKPRQCSRNCRWSSFCSAVHEPRDPRAPLRYSPVSPDPGRSSCRLRTFDPSNSDLP